MDSCSTSSPSPNWWQRLLWAVVSTSIVCLILARILLLTTAVPPTYPPLLPQQILAGTIGGALLVGCGFAVLGSVVSNEARRRRVFIALAVVLTIASFYLPYRLSFTTSPRFAGVTLAAQIGQAFLHSLVVGLSVWCFLRRAMKTIEK